MKDAICNITSRLWRDEKFQKLSQMQPSGQALWIYLISGPHTSGRIPGLVRASKTLMSGDLGWSQLDFDAAFSEIERLGMAEADWDHKVLWVPNAIYYNQPQSVSEVSAWRGEIELIPDCRLKEKAIDGMREAMSVLGAEYLQAFDTAMFAKKESSETLLLPLDPPSDERAKRKAVAVSSGKKAVTRHPGPDAILAVKRLYNDILGEVLPKVRETTTSVDRSIKARWVDVLKIIGGQKSDEEVVEWFSGFFSKVSNTGFLCGKNNRGWRADLMWLLRPENFEKVVSGRYDTLKPVDNEVSQRSEHFLRFISRYPVKSRIAEAHRIWDALGADKDEALRNEIIGYLDTIKNSSEWLRGGGKYIPGPDRYLLDRPWEIRRLKRSSDDVYELI